MHHASSSLTSRAVRAAVVAAAVAHPTVAGAQVLFSDSFDTATGANYDVFTANPASDASATFAENYSALVYQGDDGDGGVALIPVPSAPRSTGGSTSGLVMRVNDVSNAVNTISAYPKNKNFSGNYKLTFDMFMSYNGPRTGGTASTEWMIAGINQGSVAGVAGPIITGTIGGTNTGNTFAQNGDRGNGQDYRSYINQTNQGTRGFVAPNTAPQTDPPTNPPPNNQRNGETNPYYSDPVTGLFPEPEFETSGAPGKHWVTVEMSQIAGVITWKINNNASVNPLTKTIVSYADRTHTSGNLTLGYADFNSSSAPAGQGQFQFVVYDNVVVEAVDTSLFWDINGTTAGAGGAAPAGAWDATATNFNSDATGGAAGVVTPFTSQFEDVNFAAGADGTGAYTVTVTDTQAAKSVKFNRGTVTLTGGSIATNAFDVATGATGTVASVVTGGTTGTLTKTGAGTLTLSGANTYANGTSVGAGTLVAANANALGSGPLAVLNGATARLQAGLPTAVSVTGPLGITASGATGGTLDLTNNALVVRHATQAAATSGHTAVNALVRNAFHDFAWDQPGVTSSTVAAQVTAGIPAAVGILLNNDGGGNALFYGDGTALPQFEGRTVGSNDVLVKDTLLGDGDLNGVVDTVDFALFQAGYTNSAPYIGFAFGDYDYNGVVDTVDFGLFQAGYQYSQSNPPSPEMVAFATEHGLPLVAAVVPEPASLGLLALGAAGLLGRRRRRTC